jgi:hypothetical protein
MPQIFLTSALQSVRRDERVDVNRGAHLLEQGVDKLRAHFPHLVQCTHCIRTHDYLHSDCDRVSKTCISCFLVPVSIGVLRVSARCPLQRLRARKI